MSPALEWRITGYVGDRRMAWRMGVLISYLLISSAISGQVLAPKLEQTFQDPESGKNGRYLAEWPRPGTKNGEWGLLVFLPGSGPPASYASAYSIVSRTAKELRLVPLIVQAPAGAVTWAASGNGPHNQHDVYLKSLLERSVYSQYPAIDRTRTYFVGYSAGSTFLSGDFLSRHIDSYQGGTLLLCGGGGPVSSSASLYLPLKTTHVSQMPIFLYIQKKDFLYDQALQGASYWKSRRARIEVETPDGGGHCAFDLGRELQRGLKKLIELRSK